MAKANDNKAADPAKKDQKVSGPDSTEPEGMAGTDKGLFARINAVRAEITTVGHDKEVGEGQYAYSVATFHAINKMLRPLMAKHGLVDFLRPKQIEVVDTGVKRGGTVKRPLFQLRGEFEYVVCNADKADETLVTEVSGWGEDAGDKGPGKCRTYAFKMGRKEVFSISSGDEGEEDRADASNQDMPAETDWIHPENLDDLLHHADELFGVDAEQQLEAMCEKIFRVNTVADIPNGQFERAKNLLTNKAKRASGKGEEKSDTGMPKLEDE